MFRIDICDKKFRIKKIVGKTIETTELQFCERKLKKENRFCDAFSNLRRLNKASFKQNEKQ